MKKQIASACCLALLLTASPALALKASTDKNTPATTGTRATAQDLLGIMNRNGALGRDFQRMAFKQVMGLVFFDPATPDIGQCQRDVLNYHLPQVSDASINLSKMQKEIASQMAIVYTAEELQWLTQFYSSPFGARMLQKQLDMNDRMTRIIAARYSSVKPEFQKTYEVVAKRCGGTVPQIPSDAPRLSDELLAPSAGSSPILPSPERLP